MKKQSYSFPSVYETVGAELKFVSKDLIKGLQLYDNKDQAYMVGNLALKEGRSPNKLVNSSPHEIDYQLLLKSSLLLATENNNRPLVITTGFPFSTYQVYKDSAKSMIENLNVIKYNPGTYSNKGKTDLNVKIDKVEILPEMIGNIIALRAGETQAEGNFFVVSLGYGTCEAVLSTEEGIVHRTSASITGMQYAVDLFMRSLATKYYLGLKTEKQLDISFRNDHIILDRKSIDIKDLRKRILQRYYSDIISMGLRKSFTDTDFESANKIYLTGGGALFPELIEEFKKEFNEIATVEVVKNPLTLTSEGYSLNSIMLADGDKSAAIGLDIGNANTVLTQYESEDKQKKETKTTLYSHKNSSNSSNHKTDAVKTSTVENKANNKVVNSRTTQLEDKKENKIEKQKDSIPEKKAETSVNKEKYEQVDKKIAEKLIDVVDELATKTTDKPTDDNILKKHKTQEKEEVMNLSEKEKSILLNEVKKEIKDIKNNKDKNEIKKANQMLDTFDKFQPNFS